MNNANQCPNCKQYILGSYCFTCKSEIAEFDSQNIPDFLKDLFKDKGE